MNSGFLKVFLSPETNILYLWRHQATFKNPRNTKHVVETYYCILILRNFNMLDISSFENVGKGGRRQFSMIRLTIS